MRVTVDEYLDKLVEYSIMKINAIATVEETNQTWADEDDFQVIKPTIKVQVFYLLKSIFKNLNNIKYELKFFFYIFYLFLDRGRSDGRPIINNYLKF